MLFESLFNFLYKLLRLYILRHSLCLLLHRTLYWFVGVIEWNRIYIMNLLNDWINWSYFGEVLRVKYFVSFFTFDIFSGFIRSIFWRCFSGQIFSVFFYSILFLVLVLVIFFKPIFVQR